MLVVFSFKSACGGSCDCSGGGTDRGNHGHQGGGGLRRKNDLNNQQPLEVSISFDVKFIFSFSVCFQSVIFHIERHPSYPWFSQCVTFNFFPSSAHEMAYNLFNITAMYLAPLIVIIVAYTLILCEMSRKSRESKDRCKYIHAI